MPAIDQSAAPSLGLVVPLYDEEERFATHAKRLVEFIIEQPPGSELLFVDDGSTDATGGLVEELIAAHPGCPVGLLRRPHRGKGAAVAAGLRAVGGGHAGFCDLDLSTPLDQFSLVQAAANRASVLAIGSRDLASSRLVRHQGRLRETLGRAYNRLLQLTVTPGIVDTQCGAKVAARPVWDAILPHCREPGFAWDAEVVAVARALGITVLEVPIEWSHDDGSKVRVGRDGLAMVLATPRIWRRARAARLGATTPTTTPMTTPTTTPARSGVFDDANAELLMKADRAHWWFRSKAAFVATALRRTDGRGRTGWLVDAGAGAGGVTAMVGWDPNRLAVVEGNETLARQAHREHGLGALRAGVAALPLADGAADVVCLLDVIEHLGDPRVALREARRVLAPGGRLVVNVPAHEWLWSAADEVLGHERRYTRRTLRAELRRAGFEPILTTHVFSWLIAPVWLTRRARRGGHAELGLDRTSVVIDRAAMVLTAAERLAIGRVSLPLGTSVLCVAERGSTRGSSPRAPGVPARPAPGTAGSRR